MRTLTDKQFEVLTYLVTFTLDKRRQPSLQNMAEHFGMTVEGVRQHLLLIEKKNWIEYTGRGPRSIGISTVAVKTVKKGKQNA